MIETDKISYSNQTFRVEGLKLGKEKVKAISETSNHTEQRFGLVQNLSKFIPNCVGCTAQKAQKVELDGTGKHKMNSLLVDPR